MFGIEVRFFSRGHGTLYWYCNHHGLFKKKRKPKQKDCGPYRV